MWGRGEDGFTSGKPLPWGIKSLLKDPATGSRSFMRFMSSCHGNSFHTKKESQKEMETEAAVGRQLVSLG